MVRKIVFALDVQERKKQLQEFVEQSFAHNCTTLGLEPNEQNRQLFTNGCAVGAVLTQQLTKRQSVEPVGEVVGL